MFGERGFENLFFLILFLYIIVRSCRIFFFSTESLPIQSAQTEYWYWRGDKKEFDWMAGLLSRTIIQ